MEAFLQGRVKKTAAAEKSTAGKSTQIAEKKSILWVEKYRPRCVDDVVFQDEVVSVLKNCLKGADVPNLLFYGPPGTGKTSAILAVARELFGPELFKNRILELNASDERGIQVIRDKVKNFAQLAVSSSRPDGKSCPPFKLIILDEADSMTSSAQAALRRTMEKESKTTRFCLICNYVSRIIEPLTSRCSKFRFKPLSVETLRSRLEHICSVESVLCDGEVLDSIVCASEGDLRKAITFLQSAHHLRGGEGIRERDVVEIAGLVPQDHLDRLLKTCHSNMYDRLDSNVRDLIADGYSATQVISQLNDMVVEYDGFTDRQKSIICERIALVDKRLSDGADEYLQLLDLCTVIMTQLCKATPT